MQWSNNIIITGGGTGGHLAIAKAIKEELNKRKIKPIFIGSINGQDKEWFENDKDFEEKYFLKSSGIMNKNFIGKIISFFNILKLSINCRKIFKKHNIEKIITVGGFSSAPASLTAILMKKNIYIHEQNSIIGKLNNLVKPYAKEFFSSYTKESKIQDYPIDDKFFETARIRKKIKTIIFLGGSQGASNLNNFAMYIAPKLEKMDIKVIHQTGKQDYHKILTFYKKINLNADVFIFSKDINKKMEEADLAISRAGASTLWELVANGLPTIFVPYPYAVGNHQYFNAKFLEDKDLAFLKKEDELTEEFFFEILNKDLSNISKNLTKLINKNGAKKIVDIIIK